MICVSLNYGFNWTITDANGINQGLNMTSKLSYVDVPVSGTPPYKVVVTLPEIKDPLVVTDVQADDMVAVTGTDSSSSARAIYVATKAPAG